MKAKCNHRIFRALLARFLCLAHMGLSIFVLYYVKKELLYLIPIIGAVLLLVESIVSVSCYKGKDPISWFSLVFFIYVSTIVTCTWLLELENVKSIKAGQLKKDYNIFNRYNEKSDGEAISKIVATIKVIWSQLEIQIFFALIMFIRWILPKSHLTPHGLSDLLFKYFAISCDMLDFLAIIQDDVLIKSDELVYFTLSIWTWSSFQFFIFVPKFESEEKRKFTAYITNSLLSVIFLDLPYFCVRITAIFAFGSHNYNSYFFTTKNIVMILLQIVRIKATFSERKLRQDRNAKKLKEKLGFDKESTRLYNQDFDNIPIKNFEQRSRNVSNTNTPILVQKPMNEFTNNFNRNNERRTKNESSFSTPVLVQKSMNEFANNFNRNYDQRSRNGSNASTPVLAQKPITIAFNQKHTDV